MINIKVDLPGKINTDQYLKAPPYTYDTEYFMEHLPALHRHGVLKYLEDSLFGRSVVSHLNIYQASTFLDDCKKNIYEISPIEVKKRERKNIIISVFLDDIFQPLTMIKNSLSNLVENGHLEKYENIYLHLEYGAKALKGANVDYVHAFSALFSNVINRPFHFMRYTDLIKIYDLHDYDYYEGNQVWFYGDSFLKHFCLSKGSGLLDFFEKKPLIVSERIKLSPYHQISLGKLSNIVPNERLERAKDIGVDFFIEHQDALRGENHLLYKFFYTE